MLLAVFGQGARAQEPTAPIAAPAAAAPLVNGPSSVLPGTGAGPASPNDRGQTKKELPKPYKEIFFNNDFSYLDAPGYVSHDPFDALKRIEVAPRTLLDIGGEYRLRFHDEDNLRLNGSDNDYLLQRARLYGDLRYDDWLRFYAELIDSNISFNRLPPRASEEDRVDFDDLFFDVKLCEDGNGGKLWTRVGRQEIDFGSQRLLGSAEWANDRNTFDGVTAFWRSKTWDVDAFWTRPVPFARTGDGDDRNFRPADQTEQFMGVFANWHEVKDQTVDLYFLRLERDRRVVRGDLPLVPFDANTFCGRWLGRQDDWLWELEGGFQFGRFSGDQQTGGFTTTGAGHQWSCLPWKPTAWVYYDWASGDADPNNHHHGTFNQLFPQAHRYLGLSDIVGRQNIKDWNFLLTAKPCDRVTLLAEGHIFHLAEARDAFYGTGGNVIRTDPTGAAGSDVGQEYDFSVRTRLTLHAELLVTYGHFSAGSFLSRTGNGSNADFVYTQLGFKF
jgi:Alginate export